MLEVQGMPGIQLGSHIPTTIRQLLLAHPANPLEVHPTRGNLCILALAVSCQVCAVTQPGRGHRAC